MNEKEAYKILLRNIRKNLLAGKEKVNGYINNRHFTFDLTLV
jgi:hypothetical protein